MKKIVICLSAASVVLVGCAPVEEEMVPPAAPEFKINHAQGPGGGEWMDRTSPAGTASNVPAGGTESAFPSTAQPSKN